jgi:Leucine-rich repeat (LRR) protein
MKTKRILLSSRLVTVVLLTIAGFLTAPAARAEVCVGDSLALVEIYHATNGASWTSSTNWLSGPLSSWQGVQLTNGRVTSLTLTFNNLTGSLPLHLGFLQELTGLSLQGNALTGSVPVALVFLQKLKTVDLSGNKLTGGVPVTLGLTQSLVSLNLSGNQLTGSIPVTLALLSKLRSLNLSNNKLTGSIPPALGSLSGLQSLQLNDNQLTGQIPTTIGNLNSVREFLLFNNKLTGTIPTAIGGMDSVVFINLSNNKLTGAVPASIVNDKQLYFLNVESNQIKDVPNLSASTSLLQLYVASNKLTYADIEPNIVKAQNGSYAPQDSVGTNAVVTVCAGGAVTLPGNYIEASPNNSYTWFKKDLSFIADPSSSASFTITNATAANAGLYSVEISNSVAVDLILYRRTVRVKVAACAGKQSSASTISVYPVPFEGATTVAVGGEAAQVVVLDGNGTVREKYDVASQGSVEIGQRLERGTYLIQTIQGDKKESVRVIKK